MNFTMPRNMLLIPLTVLACLTGMTMPVNADDTEIFQVTANSSVSGRPKVLILFDDSGSMRTEITGQRPEYDPTKTDYDGGIDGAEFDRLYWSTDGTPPQPGGGAETQWFTKTLNRCESSSGGLNNQGFFSTGGAQRWEGSRTEESCETICSATGAAPTGWGRWFPARWCRNRGGTLTSTCTNETIPGGWSDLSRSDNSPVHVECKVDITNSEPGNGPSVADGYALDNVPDAQVFGGATPADSNVDWGNQGYTFYSANYVDYWYDDSLIEDRARIDIAKDVISNLISANTGVDFGLATFNDNTNGQDEDGGRIISRIISDMSPTERSNLVDMVNDDLTPGGWTPLCESAYEIYRYLAADEVLFGKKRDTGGTPDRDLPVRDTAAEDGDDYISPTSDCAYVYVILMTDGLPTHDNEATEAIELLTGKTCREFPDDISGNGNPKSCLPELAEYMASNDLDGDDSNGDQFGITYTIGFDLTPPAGWTGPDLLEETATLGGGLYYGANSATALSAAFQGALLSILSTESTFTSPAVAVDTFTRTESRDDVYYAMFKPDDRIDWRGNIKKLKVAAVDNSLAIVDKNGDGAIDPATGFIKDDADTFWSTDDGGLVEEGGVGELLANRNPSTRTILINTGDAGILEAFNSSNITYDAFDGLSSAAELYALFGVSGGPALETVIAYGQGYGINPDGSSTGSAREWVFGDPLHSQPLILNYGALGSYDMADPDLRVIVGTNAGFLHMFGNDDGQEDWAFFPKELASILNQRRVNSLSNDHVYGLDLTPVAYTQDVNGDGTISSSDGDKAWVYVGMRRGGRSIYAMDVSNPSSPRFLWAKGADVTGMSEMGFTWSSPVVTKIPGYVDDNDVLKPVVVVGAGYDLNKDGSGVGTDDSMGRGVFILDAETGAVVRTITPAAATATNLNVPGLVDSVPAEVTLLDSNGDELTDRLYLTDTGGNIWRVDIGSTIPTSTATESWRVVKFAQLAASGAANDRRFFNAVDAVRIRANDGTAIDVLMVGSGDRTDPLGMDVDNAFYLLRDLRTAPYTTDEPSIGRCNDPDDAEASVDFRCSLPLLTSALYDITDDDLNSSTLEVRETAQDSLASSLGWKLQLTGTGEKSLSDSITIAGRVAFTTFTPASIITNINTCEPRSGEGKLYVVDIYNGERQIIPLGPIIPDTPSVIVIDDEISFVLPPGTPPRTPDPDNPPDCNNGVCNLYETFPAPFGNYWYREEY